MKKIILLIMLLIPFKVLAVETSAKSSILIEQSTGTILSEEESHTRLPMASMTKMMTLLIVMENIEKGNIKLDDMVPISESAASMGGSQIYLSANTTMKLDTLIKAICIASANDATYAVAEYIAGTHDGFVKLMNEKVKELGLKDTNFENVHGLDSDNHYSSAYDMAFIARELLKHPKILEYSSIYEDYIAHPNGTNTWIVNTNKLLNYYDGLDGLKTGYTTKSGYCITATAKRNNMRLISVVMGEENNKIRNQDTISLLNYGFSNFKLETVLKRDENLGKIKIKSGKDEYANLKLKTDAVDLVNILEKNKYNYKISKNKVSAPLKVGDTVGTLTIYANDIKIKDIELTVDKDIKRANYFDYFKRNIKYFIRGCY